MENLQELKPVGKLSPFAHFCCTIGNLPTSYMISLTYEEQLLWLCNYLEKTVIPAVNTNAEAVAELQDLYIQLKEYVDNYFSDLNVQEQINNKLDEMAESGELAEIINEEIFENLNTQINQNTENIENLQNRKIINYLASKYNTLQDAIDDAYAHNDVVYLDENIEINEPTTRIDAKCSLIGLENSKILCSYIDIVQPNVKIENIEIIGYSDRIININTHSETPLNNIKINNCKLYLNNNLTNLPFSIIYASQTTPINNLQIINNYIENSGIQLANCINFRIENNYIDGLMNSISENELIHTSFKSSGIITNNILCNCLYDFIDIFSAGQKTIITNNKMTNGKMNGIECKVVLADNGGSSDTIGFVENCIISNNIISDLNAEDNGEYAGILAVMYDTRTDKTPVPTENETPKNLIITNNIIRDININVGAKYCGIKTSANNTIISNNIIQNLHNGDTKTGGIYLYTQFNTPSETQIVNNRLKGCYPYGIYLQHSRNCLINANTFQRDSEGNNNNYGNLHAIGIENGYGILITNNVIKNTADYGIFQTSEDNLIQNITISNNDLNNSSISLTNITHSLISHNMFNQSHISGQPSLKINSSTARRL